MGNNKNNAFDTCEYRNGHWSQNGTLKWGYVEQVFSALLLLAFWDG